MNCLETHSLWPDRGVSYIDRLFATIPPPDIALDSTDSNIRVVSDLPGRVRFVVPLIRKRPLLARSVEYELKGHASVTSVKANPVSYSVLVLFSTESTLADIRALLLESLSVAIEIERQGIERQGVEPDRTAHTEEAEAPGTALIVHGEDSETPTPLQRLVHATARYPDLRRRAIASSIADGLAESVPPFVIGLAVGTIANGPTSLLGRLGFATARSRLLALGGVSVALWGLAAILEYIKEIQSAELADVVRRDLRLELYEHIQGLDVSMVESRDITEWMTVLDQDVDRVHDFIRQGTDPLVSMASNTFIVGTAFAIAAPGLGLAQLLIVPPLVLASMKLLKPLKEHVRVERRYAANLREVVSGNVQGISTLVSLDAQDDQLEKVREASELHLEQARLAHRVDAIYVPTLRSIVGVGFISTLTWGGWRAVEGAMSVGALDTLATTQLRLMASLARVGRGLENYQRTGAALERIYSTLEIESNIKSGDRRLEPSAVSGRITFNDLHFEYEEGRPVFDSLTLECKAGETTAVVGSTGSGKSTLTRLLMRFYDPKWGSVSIDGIDLRELHLRDLRRTIAMVPQEIVLFSGSIRENIAFGNPDASNAQVEDAARLAEAHDFVSDMPGGYETRIGFGGVTLSGGQRQRLAIARALLSKSQIIVFDEATSSLDYETEALIQRAVEGATEGRTAIIIAHRLSTIRRADKICVLEEGHLVEEGTHDELVAAGGLYANMWKVQTGELVPA